MTSTAKLKMYDYYKGNSDGFARAPKRHWKVLSEEEFSTITGLIQHINFVIKNLTSTEYAERINKRINNICDDIETITFLNSMAVRY